jgi:hypothetical protein
MYHYRQQFMYHLSKLNFYEDSILKYNFLHCKTNQIIKSN